MPTGPKGPKRPADAIGRAVRIAKIVTGEVNDDKRVISESAVKGEKARAKALGSEAREEIARKAAKARWAKAD